MFVVGTYRGSHEDRADPVQLRLGDGLPTKAMVGVLNIDKIQMRLGSDRNEVGILRMPLHSVKRIHVSRREHAKDNLSPENHRY